ncbi:MAG: ribosome silencing factor [Actinomycetota bacterium]
MPPRASTSTRTLAVAAARAASDKKASDVVVLGVGDLIVITDYFVIASGATERQVRSIADAIERALAEKGVKPLRREGIEQGRWVLLDFVDIVVHVFTVEDRAYYELERLWKDAPRVSWEETARTGSRRTRASQDRSG